MANLILTSEGWQERIRDKMGVSSSYLSDSAIEQPDIIDVAEAIITDIITDYAELTGSDKTFLEAATVCQCCALICPSMPSRLPQREQSSYFTKDAPQKWDKAQEEFVNERDFYLRQIDSTIGVDINHFDITRDVS